MPKLLFPVLGKPMIYWTLDLLKGAGIEEVVLGVNYLAENLRASVGSEYNGMSIKYSLESQELGTAGPMKLASASTEMNETFVAMNGDVIAQINLRDMLGQHRRTGALVSDALHEVEAPSRFGVVELDAQNRIQRFVEKPKPGTAPSRLVNAGIYMIQSEVLELIAPNQKVSLEREIFPTLAKEGKLSGFPFNGHWFDIGNLTDFRRANFSLLRDSMTTATNQGENCVISTDALIRNPVHIGNNSRIQDKARVGPNVLLGNDSSIARRAKVAHSIIFDRVHIGEDSQVEGAILAAGVKVGKKAKIDRGCIISPGVTIADRVKIQAEAIVHPFKEVNQNVRAAAHIM
jgi:mannose-1-phosphate guanylyltransferase